MEYIVILKGDVRPILHSSSIEEAMSLIIKNKLLILAYVESGYLAIIFAEDKEKCFNIQ